MLISFSCMKMEARGGGGQRWDTSLERDLVPVLRWEECREGASGDEAGPQMPVMSCPCSGPVGRARAAGAEITVSPSTRRGGKVN